MTSVKVTELRLTKRPDIPPAKAPAMSGTAGMTFPMPAVARRSAGGGAPRGPLVDRGDHGWILVHKSLNEMLS